MSNVTLTLPDAWITEDGALFIVAKVYAPMTRVFEAGNKALEENGYDERISFANVRPPYGRCWVDPAYVAAEQWPDSAVSTVAVPGWVKLHRIDIEDLESHAPSTPEQPEGENRG